MSRKRFCMSSVLVVIAVAALFAIGIVTLTNAQTAEKRMAPGAGHAVKASDLIGQSVYTPANEEKGKIKDLMLGGDGKIEYAVVSFGGFLGIGDKLFAVPMDAIQLTWKDNKVERAQVNVTEQTIKQRQGFDDSRWPERADKGFSVGEQVHTK